LWAKDVGNLWRTTGIFTIAGIGKKEYSTGWLVILDQQVGLETYAGPGTGMIRICSKWATAA